METRKLGGELYICSEFDLRRHDRTNDRRTSMQPGLFWNSKNLQVGVTKKNTKGRRYYISSSRPVSNHVGALEGFRDKCLILSRRLDSNIVSGSRYLWSKDEAGLLIQSHIGHIFTRYSSSRVSDMTQAGMPFDFRGARRQRRKDIHQRYRSLGLVARLGAGQEDMSPGGCGFGTRQGAG